MELMFMVKETYIDDGQKVTTHYKPTGKMVPDSSGNVTRTSYKRADTRTKEQKLHGQSDRRQQNRDIRDAAGGPANAGTLDDYDDAPAYGKGEKPLVAKPTPSKKKTISTGGLPFASVGKNFSDLQQQMGPPTWMNQSGGKRGKVSAPRAFGNVPGWVMGGRAPWDSSPESGHKDIVRTIITKVHEDGTKTRTVRGPPAPKKGSNKPNWISW